jgi:hypothetical protein
MKQFDRFFKLFAKATELVAAEKCFFGNLALEEEPGRLRFVTDASTDGPQQFLSWFRRVFLALCGGMAFMIYQDLAAGSPGIIKLIAWGFILFLSGMGLAGAFLIVPTLITILRRIESQGDRDNAKLPIFDLANRVVVPPDAKVPCPFDRIAGIKSAGVDARWRKLVLLTTDNDVVFLVNYPVSETKRITNMLNCIAERTGLKILD